MANPFSQAISKPPSWWQWGDEAWEELRGYMGEENPEGVFASSLPQGNRRFERAYDAMWGQGQRNYMRAWGNAWATGDPTKITPQSFYPKPDWNAVYAGLTPGQKGLNQARFAPLGQFVW
mgnify:CR=1 FL=1